MEWLSFAWGVLAGLIGSIATGFFKGAGKKLWELVEAKIWPPPPEDVLVGPVFDPDPAIYDPDQCKWSALNRVSERLLEGWTFYPHASNGGRCVRNDTILMVMPGAGPKKPS